MPVTVKRTNQNVQPEPVTQETNPPIKRKVKPAPQQVVQPTQLPQQPVPPTPKLKRKLLTPQQALVPPVGSCSQAAVLGKPKKTRKQNTWIDFTKNMHSKIMCRMPRLLIHQVSKKRI